MPADDRQGLITYRAEERSFILSYLIVVVVSIVLCIITRAPSTFEKVGFQGFELKVNVGFVLALGPWLILGLVIWLHWTSDHVKEQRQALGVFGAVPNPRRWISLAFYLLPGLASFFLLRQLVFETTEPGTDCDQFDHLRLFWDFSLLRTNGWQPAYCFGLKPEQQVAMPYFFPPIQIWAHLAAAGATTWLGVHVWRNLLGGGRSEEQGPAMSS